MGLVRAGLAFLVFIFLSVPPEGVAQAHDAPCETLTFEGDPFTVCRAEAGRDEISLSLLGASGKPLRRLSMLKTHLGDGAGKVRFAMNAGIFDGKHAPIGLYVENGKQLKAISTRDGFGNFHLKPNGVFWVGADGAAHVTTSDAYVSQKPKAIWATQSGPLLVIDGKLHPKISHNGESRYTRNGVGVTDKGDALFVISDAPVSFGKLARLFRDELGCDDALYFDGAVSALWAPLLGRMDAGRDLGPMVVVTSP
jgi:uncharacterized protein YigE (DUF2233 family)